MGHYQVSYKSSNASQNPKMLAYCIDEMIVDDIDCQSKGANNRLYDLLMGWPLTKWDDHYVPSMLKLCLVK